MHVKAPGNSRRLLDATFECLDDALLIIDPTTRNILECNPAVERVFGYSRQALIGRSTDGLHVDREAYERFGKDRLFSSLKRVPNAPDS
jgi:PAS domain S-box-containing protein